MTVAPDLQVTQLACQACARHPGGIRAVFQSIKQERGETGKARSESHFYAELNPNPTSLAKLKVETLISVMVATGDVEPLRYLAAYFGYSLASLDAVEPDAPTLEAEMLSDYPSLVAFHKAVQDFREGKATALELNAKEELALLDIRQTFTMAVKG